MGLSQKQAVAILYAISAILALAAVVITTSGENRAHLLNVAVMIPVVNAGDAIRGVSHDHGLHGGHSEKREENASSIQNGAVEASEETESKENGEGGSDEL
jgi:UDP-GlcNAc:undecaprenyl-phosphate GlcNAc-1-phosphate transferase